LTDYNWEHKFLFLVYRRGVCVLGDEISNIPTITVAREKAGISTQQLAAALEISEERLMKIEKRPSVISPHLAKRISLALGKDIDGIDFN
jgi:DNA-binding XRE family transcriptional regulator